MSPFHAAEIMALLTFLIGCASFHRVLGRTSSRSSYMPPESGKSSRNASSRTATPVPGRISQPVVKSSRSPNAAFRVVRLRGELTLVAEHEISLKKAA